MERWKLKVAASVSIILIMWLVVPTGKQIASMWIIPPLQFIPVANVLSVTAVLKYVQKFLL